MLISEKNQDHCSYHHPDASFEFHEESEQVGDTAGSGDYRKKKDRKDFTDHSLSLSLLDNPIRLRELSIVKA